MVYMYMYSHVHVHMYIKLQSHALAHIRQCLPCLESILHDIIMHAMHIHIYSCDQELNVVVPGFM